jgi:hypothetical protein
VTSQKQGLTVRFCSCATRAVGQLLDQARRIFNKWSRADFRGVHAHVSFDGRTLRGKRERDGFDPAIAPSARGDAALRRDRRGVALLLPGASSAAAGAPGLSVLGSADLGVAPIIAAFSARGRPALGSGVVTG